MNIRRANPGDIPQLAELRWLFRSNLDEPEGQMAHQVFLEGMTAFLEQIMASKDWAIWLAG